MANRKDRRESSGDQMRSKSDRTLRKTMVRALERRQRAGYRRAREPEGGKDQRGRGGYKHSMLSFHTGALKHVLMQQNQLMRIPE